MIQEAEKKKLKELLDILFLCKIRADSASVTDKDRMIIRFFESFDLNLFCSAISSEPKLKAKYKKLETDKSKEWSVNLILMSRPIDGFSSVAVKSEVEFNFPAYDLNLIDDTIRKFQQKYHPEKPVSVELN